MIIVSQNKELIANMDQASSIEIYDLGESESKPGRPRYRILVYGVGAEDCCGIGDYQTKERCKEIFTEIRNRYGEYLHRQGDPAILRGSVEVSEAFWVLPKVYDMPEE